MSNTATVVNDFVYERGACVAFRKITEPYGGLSNMALDYPLEVNGVFVPTSEALYQSCRFTHLPEVQRLIVEQASPWCAKRKSRIFLHDSRADWTSVRVEIMDWVQRVKLAQHFDRFATLLLSTENSPIVEESVKDAFWGATRCGDNELSGANVLGRILTQLRVELSLYPIDRFLSVEPPGSVSDLQFYGSPVLTVSR